MKHFSQGSETAAARLKTCIAVLAGAVMLALPALRNGYPLIQPDSIPYLEYGDPILAAVLHPRSHWINDLRAEFYALGIYFLHYDRWLWPIVVMNALLMSLVLWYLVRVEVRSHTRTAFLAILLFLSLTTNLSWYASSILTDVFGPPAYIALYLIVFHWEGLAARERWMLAACAWWGIIAHTTHLLVSSGLCAVLVSLSLTPWKQVANRRRSALMATALVAFAAFSEIAFHGLLYGKATLNGKPPPYLMARAISDGPAVLYLKQNCPQLNWTICKHVDNLPDLVDQFLWDPAGVWQASTDAERNELRKEELPLVEATLRTYPRAQFRRSFFNFRQQLIEIGLYGSAVRGSLLTSSLDSVIHGAVVPYEKSLQAQGRLPIGYFTALQESACFWSAIALAVLIPLAWIRGRRSKLPLTIVVVTVLVLNALVCGVLSGVSMRYQGRVIWLLPMLAILLAIDLFDLRPADGNSTTKALPKAGI